MTTPTMSLPHRLPHTRATPCCIALGSNVGDRLSHLRRACAALAVLPETQWISASPIYETAPVGPQDQGAYLNAVVRLETQLSAQALHAALQELEDAAGRDRSVARWGPRVLDLDILLLGDTVIHTQDLTVPHPRLHERWFVLQPMADVAGTLNVPGLGRTVTELLAAVSPDPTACVLPDELIPI